MAVATADSNRASAEDTLMELFDNEDATFDDLLNTVNATSRDARQDSSRPVLQSSRSGDLGIDEEVNVKKARPKIAKLDESRLTSAAGIPKLQKIAKSRMKFRGKGHEFSDVAMLLHTYQLWLHDLYPRAKFNDGLAIIEKLGHTKSMQRLRSGWINESKPTSGVVNDSDDENLSATSDPGFNVDPAPLGSNITPDTNSSSTSEIEPAHTHAGALTTDQNTLGDIVGAPEDDELDQLLAEELSPLDTIPDRNSSTSTVVPHAPRQSTAGEEEHFGDEEDVMRELGLF